MYFGPQPCLPSSPVSIIAAMTTLHTRKDPLLRGVSPTPSKIPILSQRCSEFPSVKSCSLDQENQDPRVRGAWVKRVRRWRQLTLAMHPSTECQFFCSPSLRSHRSVLKDLSLTQLASNRKPCTRKRNHKEWGALSSGTLWRNSNLALGDQMWDLCPSPRKVPAGNLGMAYLVP